MGLSKRISWRGPACDDPELRARLPGALRSLLEPDNGFVCLDGALHVRGACRAPRWHSLREAWLAPDGVVACTPGLQPGDIPFARTTFGDELLLRDHDVLRVVAETRAVEALGVSLGRFARALERDPVAFLRLDPRERALALHTEGSEPDASTPPAPDSVAVDITASPSVQAEQVLAFWFGDAAGGPDDRASGPDDAASGAAAAASGAARAAAAVARWFAGDPAFDDACRRRFAALLAVAERDAADGRAPLPDWGATARCALARLVVLDQLPRNLHRGQAAAFALDGAARAASAEALEHGFDQLVHPLGALFFYLPLEHSESLADQQRCVALVEALRARAPQGLEARFDGFVDYARRHLAIVERFGRFPHRNAALARADSDAERRFLAAGGSSF